MCIHHEGVRYSATTEALLIGRETRGSILGPEGACMGGAVVAARLGVGVVTSEGEKSTKQGDTGIWTVAWVPGSV